MKTSTIWFARTVLALAVLGVAGVADAQNVPAGLTGLWRFQTSAEKLKATIGVDLTTSNPDNSAWMPGPWTMIGVPENAGLYADGGVVQERSWDYLTVNPRFGPNGGGGYVNEYTVLIDYAQTQKGWNSLFQTNWDGNVSDGDLWILPNGMIGSGDLGYSGKIFDSSKWHRIVWSVDNGSFFRVYVDGTLFLDGTPQAVDGRYSLYPNRFHLFADDSWQDMWGLVGTVMTWRRALTSDEVAGMGGWIGGLATPTELIMVMPEPVALGLDILPDSCPNALSVNMQTKGRLPVAILGSATFDVSTVEVNSISIGGVAFPVKAPTSLDVSAPAGTEECACQIGTDGYADLVLHFSRRDVIQALGLDQMARGTVVPVTVDGYLADDTPFTATDCVTIVGPE